MPITSFDLLAVDPDFNVGDPNDPNDTLEGRLQFRINGEGRTTYRLQLRATWVDPITNLPQSVVLGTVPALPAPARETVNFNQTPQVVRFVDFDRDLLPIGVTIDFFLDGAQNSDGGLGRVFSKLIGDDIIICFLSGTRIATPSGEVAVETLAPGDQVLTADGRTLPVRFVGKQVVASRFATAGDAFPIRIAAGALGENLPTRDLLVSRAHAIAFGDVLVQAGALVNGTTIRQVTEMPETFTYYHVDVAEHALLVAEGVAAELYRQRRARPLPQRGGAAGVPADGRARHAARPLAPPGAAACPRTGRRARRRAGAAGRRRRLIRGATAKLAGEPALSGAGFSA